MKTKPTEIRTKADFTLPCPECGTECWPDRVTKQYRRKLKTGVGPVLVLPQHYLDLHCSNCKLELWLAVDAAGKPITEDDEL